MLQSDEMIVKQYLSDGNSRWLGLLFKKYQTLIYGVCWKYLENREDARDATMEIFEKLHLDIQKFEIQHFKSWLYQVARNHCLMKLRKKQPKFEYKDMMNSDLEGNDVEWTTLAEEEVGTQTEENRLNECMEKLKSIEQKRCVDMFYYKDKSYKEIESETGLSFNEVKSFIQNGKLNLKKCLEKKK